MLSGFELPIERLAFSQPTAQGRALAESYTGTQRFLVYAERPAEPAPAAAAAPRPGGPAAPAAAAASTEQGPHDSSARPPFLPPDYDVH
jgi:hypothetical protein